MDIEKIVIDCAAQVYEKDAAAIKPETVIREELSNQSLKLIAFLSYLEDELDAVIEFQEAMGLVTIGDVIEKIKSLKGIA